jgi:hypothetical protein
MAVHMKQPYARIKMLTHEQWQQARRMWNDGKDTHDIACVLGCYEAHIYNGLYLLKMRRESEAA